MAVALTADGPETKHDFRRDKGEIFFRCKHCKLSLSKPFDVRMWHSAPCAEYKEQLGWNTEAQETC